MNLSYINITKHYKHFKEAKVTYLSAFPKHERLPFCIARFIAYRKGVSFKAIEIDNRFVGLIYLLEDKKSVYLLYFAIKENERNKSYGANILDDLLNQYANKEFYLSIEIPNEIEPMTIRRFNFYKRHGLISAEAYLHENISYLLLANRNIDNFDNINSLLKKSFFFKYRPYVDANK